MLAAVSRGEMRVSVSDGSVRWRSGRLRYMLAAVSRGEIRVSVSDGSVRWRPADCATC